MCDWINTFNTCTLENIYEIEDETLVDIDIIE